VTCPSLLRRSAAAPEAVLGELTDLPVGSAEGLADRAAARMQQDDAWAQLVRFLLVGGSSTLLYGLLFVALHGVGSLPAHVSATVASSIFANEAHRRLTFHAEGRVSWLAAQWEAGGVSLIGLLATSGALGWLGATDLDAPETLQIGVVLLVTTLIGALRFVALRWIFRPEEHAPA
jgi:putative flippase GtrA